jgi:hypothetical protein
MMPVQRQTKKAMKRNMINKDIDKDVVVMDKIKRDGMGKGKKKKKTKKMMQSMKGC